MVSCVCSWHSVAMGSRDGLMCGNTIIISYIHTIERKDDVHTYDTYMYAIIYRAPS